jgi:bifunctional non-homologous end joining protein LigD
MNDTASDTGDDMAEIKQITPGKCKAIGQDVLTQAGVSDWIMEEKIDGHRGLLHFGKSLDRAYLTSRRISTVTKRFSENGLCVPHLLEEVAGFVENWGPGYTVIDGEIVVEGGAFENVQSVMGSKPENAIAWQEANTKAMFIAYDILWVDSQDLRGEPYYNRMISLKSLLLRDQFEFIRIHEGQSTYGGVQAFFESVVAAGGEGIVIKDVMAKYGQGVWKLKGVDTFDVVISGFQDGKGKFKELIGAVEFSCFEGEELVRVGKCSGMEDGAVRWAFEGDKGKDSGNYLIPCMDGPGPEGSRSWFTHHRDSLIGTVIEVKSSGLTAKGKLRHPRFMRTRPDKDKTMCPMPRDQVNKE